MQIFISDFIQSHKSRTEGYCMPYPPGALWALILGQLRTPQLKLRKAAEAGRASFSSGSIHVREIMRPTDKCVRRRKNLFQRLTLPQKQKRTL
ncbi:hypothetical protein CDAR_307811 [Caerostris darwini]|uniref:Uncharacterized protein n=1 Tax=Caerostris darwini TaxID=1538125 RepID=A0AAV4WFR9_9ARAC|nr:hypothetical protein CDAR_307811 [Caerostris darwini]